MGIIQRLKDHAMPGSDQPLSADDHVWFEMAGWPARTRDEEEQDANDPLLKLH